MAPMETKFQGLSNNIQIIICHLVIDTFIFQDV